MPSSNAPDERPVDPTAPPPPRRRVRRVSRARQTFLNAIHAQIAGTRILALVVLLVCLSGGVYWLVGTTGSRVVGFAFIALALMLCVTIYSFIKVMYMFTGKQ
jgi:hypothetical protein